MTINLANKQEIIKKYAKKDGDTGPVEVQVALITQKVRELTEHLKINNKDFQGRRGLLMLVGKRKRLLTYLKKENLERYRSLIKELDIRK